jgi:hypothetical protein
VTLEFLPGGKVGPQEVSEFQGHACTDVFDGNAGVEATMVGLPGCHFLEELLFDFQVFHHLHDLSYFRQAEGGSKAPSMRLATGSKAAGRMTGSVSVTAWFTAAS